MSGAPRTLATLVAGSFVMAVLAVYGWPVAAGASPAAAPQSYYSYSAKFVCGTFESSDPEQAVVRPGFYATEINIHNYQPEELKLEKRVIPLVIQGRAIGREPEFSKVQGEDGIVLPPDTATMDDCARITRILGLAPDEQVIGFLEIRSRLDLSVDAVYTVEGRSQANTDIDVERVEGKLVGAQER